MRFGVSRIPFRDEVGEDGEVVRMWALWQRRGLRRAGAGGRPGRRHRGDHTCLAGAPPLLADYTQVGDDLVRERYCTYNVLDGDGAPVCDKCVRQCPSGALPNFVPDPDGAFSERILSQSHRFSGSWLKFDFGNCCRDRGQKAQIYSDYVCARCVSICAAEGVRKPPGALTPLERVEQAAAPK